MRNNICIFLLLLSSTTWSFSQDTLSLQQAMDRALKANYGIAIARNDAKIADNNNHAGNAGMLPNVFLNIGDTPSNSNLKQEFANGTIIERDGVFGNNFQAAVALNWTLYDGGRMFATRDKLEELKKFSDESLKIQIQNTMTSVVQAYSQVSLQQNYLNVLRQLLELSESRYQLVKKSLENGLANQSDLYLAELERSSRQQAITTQEIQIQNGYQDLNILLNFPADTAYVVSSSIALNGTLNREESDQLFIKNPELTSTTLMKTIALFSEKEQKASMRPRIGLTASYGYSLAQSEAGFSLYNQNYGPTATLSVSVPLFTGHVNQRNYENAQIASETAALREKQTLATLQSMYEKAWNLYTSLQAQVEIDYQSTLTATEYLKIIEERYKVGQSTVLEYQDAQRNYEEINYRKINNQYLLKLAETDLLRLTGKLLGS